MFKKLFFFSFLSSTLVVGAYILDFYFTNSAELKLSEITSLALGSLILISAACLFSGFIFKGSLLPALPFCFLFLFQHSSLETTIRNFGGFSKPGITAIGIIFIFCLLTLLAAYLLRKSQVIYKVFAFSSIFFIAHSSQAYLLSSGSDKFTDELRSKLFELRRPALNIDQLGSNFDLSNAPDIVYIVPDRYGNLDGLKEHFGFDNSAFYDELENRGFIVNRNSYANYPATFLSFPSYSNSQYLYEFMPVLEKTPNSTLPLQELANNNWAQESLRNLGYDFLFYGGFYKDIRRNSFADFNFTDEYQKGALNLTNQDVEFWKRTPLYELYAKFLQGTEIGDCEFTYSLFDDLKSRKIENKPVLVYAHIMIPHDPFYLDSKGNCRNPADRYPEDWETRKKYYIEYMQYFNQEILKVIDEYKKNNRDLVFIIQSDEGPFPEELFLDRVWGGLSQESWQLKLGNINALYSSKKLPLQENDLKTPINNWLLIFNNYFETNIPYSEHKSFIHLQHSKDHQENYNFSEINFN